MTIKELRAGMGLSQRKFADYFGIPVVNVQHWEQGVAKPPEYVVRLIDRVIKLERSSHDAKEVDNCGESYDDC